MDIAEEIRNDRERGARRLEAEFRVGHLAEDGATIFLPARR